MTLDNLTSTIPYPEINPEECALFVEGSPVWDYKYVEDIGMFLIAGEDGTEEEVVNLGELIDYCTISGLSLDTKLFSEDTRQEFETAAYEKGIIFLYE